MTYLLLSPWLLWGCYVIVMGLKRARDAGTLTTAQKVFGYPFLIIGLALDLLVNLIFATAIFAERPREWTVSARLTRLSEGEEGWRKDTAIDIRVALLDSLDPAGIHRG